MITDRFASSDLVPMSMEELKLNHYHNRRTNKIMQLWFVDQSGNHHLFIESEIKSLKLNEKYPFYMITDWGIKKINRFRDGL